MAIIMKNEKKKQVGAIGAKRAKKGALRSKLLSKH